MADRPPPPRLALRREEAAQALGMSDESFDRYVRPHVPVCYFGTLRVWPVAGLIAFLDREAFVPGDAVISKPVLTRIPEQPG